MTWEGRLKPGQDLEGLRIIVFAFACISKDSVAFTVVLIVKYRGLWRGKQNYRGNIEERNT